MSKQFAFIIGNGGIGDMITYIGMINYLSTKYKIVLVACMKHNYEQCKYFFNNTKIKLYPINLYDNTTMNQFDHIMRNNPIYDIYAFGHYGAKTINYNEYLKIRNDGKMVNIIYDYPKSYYEDVNIPFEYMVKYFNVSYPQNILDLYSELFKNYSKYIVVHQIGSTQTFDIIKHNKIDIDDILVIDVNKNLYKSNHKYYDIANKFVNLIPVVFYTKLIENASSLYLIDSCIHAISLIVDINNAKPRICYQREGRIKYEFDKFDYFLLINGKPIKIKLPIKYKITNQI